jgi:cyclase
MAAPQTLCAQEGVRGQEIAPGVLLIVDQGRNLVASVGSDGAFLVGPQTKGASTRLEPLLQRATRGPLRYILLAPVDSGTLTDDGGWSSLGAFVTTHESMKPRLRRWAKAAGLDTSARKFPVVTYSEVIAFELNGESIHTVHMPAGYSDADAITHFHTSNVIHLGGSFTADGYPNINPGQKGTITGMIETVSRFLQNTDPTVFVGDRGPIGRPADLKAYHAMLVAVRDRVRALADSGQSEDTVVRRRPTASFDARWGQGVVGAEAFVRAVYRSLNKK